MAERKVPILNQVIKAKRKADDKEAFMRSIIYARRKVSFIIWCYSTYIPAHQ